MRFALLLAPALLAAAGADARIPLHWLWHEQQTDSVYTVSAERREWLKREQGYVDMGPIAYVEERAADRARPLKCFYSSAPRTNTFCTISALEQRLVRSMGYVDVGIEGFVHEQKFAGSVVLYRLNRSYGDGRDREHRFVTSGDELVRLRKLGWTYDGSKGFVSPVP